MSEDVKVAPDPGLAAPRGPQNQSQQQPSIGRIVHYKISAENAIQVNRRRTSSAEIANAIAADQWSKGAQAHIGNSASAGNVVPLIIVGVWPDEYGPGIPGVNGQAFLDGNDSLWVTSAKEGDAEGQWSWPPRV